MFSPGGRVVDVAGLHTFSLEVTAGLWLTICITPLRRLAGGSFVLGELLLSVFDSFRFEWPSGECDRARFLETAGKYRLSAWNFTSDSALPIKLATEVSVHERLP